MKRDWLLATLRLRCVSQVRPLRSRLTAIFYSLLTITFIFRSYQPPRETLFPIFPIHWDLSTWVTNKLTFCFRLHGVSGYRMGTVPRGATPGWTQNCCKLSRVGSKVSSQRPFAACYKCSINSHCGLSLTVGSTCRLVCVPANFYETVNKRI